MAEDKNTLTIVVGKKIVKPEWSKRQCASVEWPVHTGPNFPKPLHPGVSLNEPGEYEAKLLEMTKLPPDSCFYSFHSRKLKTPATHAKSKRVQINPPSHNLAGQGPGLRATALASKADTSPSPRPPVSNVGQAVIADDMETISNENVSTIKDIDPLGYYTTSEKDFIDHAKEPPWGPENASKDEGTLTLREFDPLSYFCIIKDDAVNDIQGLTTLPSTPPTASSFYFATNRLTIYPFPDLEIDHHSVNNSPIIHTIVTTQAKIKAATLEAMTETKSEILTEMKTLMKIKIKNMGLGSTMEVIADEVDGAEDTDSDKGEARRNVNGQLLLFRGFHAWKEESWLEYAALGEMV
ncbi:MAG: hypothetical protein Q9204_004010 [Flavoplaca sp. TL-2023a]